MSDMRRTYASQAEFDADAAVAAGEGWHVQAHHQTPQGIEVLYTQHSYHDNVRGLAITVIFVVIVGAVIIASMNARTSVGGTTPTARPPAGPIRAAVGQVVPIAEANLDVTVLNGLTLDQGSSFGQPAPGNTFYMIEVQYEAFGSGGTYSVTDWSAFVDNRKLSVATVLDPKYPSLSIGTLAAGRTVSGWVAFEGPADAASVAIDYTWNLFLSPNPVFEVVFLKHPTAT